MTMDEPGTHSDEPAPKSAGPFGLLASLALLLSVMVACVFTFTLCDQPWWWLALPVGPAGLSIAFATKALASGGNLFVRGVRGASLALALVYGWTSVSVAVEQRRERGTLLITDCGDGLPAQAPRAAAASRREATSERVARRSCGRSPASAVLDPRIRVPRSVRRR